VFRRRVILVEAKPVRWRVAALASVALLSGAWTGASALTIVRHFIDSGPPAQNVAGGGNLIDLFNAAADRWELAIRDDHTVVLHFGWSGVGCLGGQHTLQTQGGSPHREIEGSIFFDNLGYQIGCPSCPCGDWFMDPTPNEDEEFSSFTEEFADAGGGPVSVTRSYASAGGDAALPNMDLLSVAMHEIGHALGLSVANARFVAESGDLDIDVLAPRPLPGTTIPLASNDAGVTSHIDSAVYYGPLMASVPAGARRFPSGLDILANAQLSEFTNLDLDPPAPVLAEAGGIGSSLAIRSGAGGELTLEWLDSCAASAGDYEIYEGALGGDFTSHAARFCTTAGRLTATFLPSPGDTYYLVVPRNTLREGSYGRRSNGAERPPAGVACRPRLIGACF
jgi:hypothetical protein